VLGRDTDAWNCTHCLSNRGDLREGKNGILIKKILLRLEKFTDKIVAKKRAS
jgi:hypothetical protein